jgi:hypothetical protein
MGVKFGAWIGCGVLALSACTNDFDSFSFGAGAQAGADTGGTGGANTGGANTGGTNTGGTNTGGTNTGGANTGGTSTGGTNTGGANTGGATGCKANEKTCNAQCVVQDDPAFGCGATSCDPCTIANATPECAQSKCALKSCDTGFGDCNNDSSNGCETDLTINTAHCGACQRACGTTKSVGAGCVQGLCRHRCEAGFGDCAQPATGPDDGCETDTKIESANCGSCGNDCSKQGGDSGLSCSAGICGCSGDKQCEIGGGANGTCDTATGLCACDGTTCAPGEACHKSGAA